MKVQEQVKAFEAKREAHVARMADIMSKSAEEGRTLDATEQEEYDNLEADVKAIDEHLVRARKQEKLMADKATPVSVEGNGGGEANVRVPVVSGMKDRLPKGTGFTRWAMALAHGRGDTYKSLQFAQQWKDSTPQVIDVIAKTAVAPGVAAAGTATWAGNLAYAENLVSEFIELLMPETILGRLNGLRRVPFNVRMPRTTAGSTVNWVGENKPKPVSAMAFDTVTMTWAKIAGIVVLTEELVRVSSPSAEAVVRQNLIDTISQFMDQQFIDPTVTVSAGVSPASITNGAHSRQMSTSTGSITVGTVTADVQDLFTDMDNNGVPLRNGYWVMHPRSATYLSLLRTAQDIYAFPQITRQGGTWFGLPVVTSANVPIDTGDDTYIVLLDASEIFYADDGATSLDVSREASVQMDSAPSDGAQSLVSFWQNNLIGLKAERFANWARRRDAAVGYIFGVSY
jgi:HK97 family phage major capsid protein